MNGPGALSLNQLNTTDPEAAQRFYTDLFGWRFEEMQGGPGPYSGIYRGDRVNGGMMQMPPGQPAPPHWLVYFGIDDIDAAAERIASSGGRVVRREDGRAGRADPRGPGSPGRDLRPRRGPVRRLMAHPNDELIVRFYEAFARGDGDAMAACYAPGAHFSDPVFTDLNGEEPGAMWRMLTSRATDLEVRLAEHDADAERGSAHWLADYTFRTGRRVHNDIRAEFRFEDGLIADHRDSFSFYAWARQALGPTGLALGWTPLVRGKVQREARAGLDEFLGNRS